MLITLRQESHLCVEGQLGYMASLGYRVRLFKKKKQILLGTALP